MSRFASAVPFAAFALVQAKKHMVLVIGVGCHAGILGGGFVCLGVAK